MASMDSFRKRYVNAKLADDDRNALIEDLLQTVQHMQKAMETNTFVLVLIDGDSMNFLDELIKQGIEGGDQAAKRLQKSVFEYLRYDEDFNHDDKIVIKVYANLRRLTKTYTTNSIVPHAPAFHEFVLGFNEALPLCDFIDAGNSKEATDKKMKENLSLYIYNVHCKQIILGPSAGATFASFLSSFSTHTDVPSRIRILKGSPFSYEFSQIISRFKWTEFKDVFRSEKIANEADQHQAPHNAIAWTSSGGAHAPWPWTPRNKTGPYPANVDFKLPVLEDRVNEPRPFPTQLR